MASLRSQGAELSEFLRFKEKALFWAAANGDDALLGYLLRHKLSPDSTDEEGNTPLHIAIHATHINTIKTLLGCDCSLTVANKAGETAVQLAGRLGLGDVIVPLLTPTQLWQMYKAQNNVRSGAMDELMQMTGIKKVKEAAMDMYNAILLDKSRPPNARTTRNGLNFVFTGNPGKHLQRGLGDQVERDLKWASSLLQAWSRGDISCPMLMG